MLHTEVGRTPNYFLFRMVCMIWTTPFLDCTCTYWTQKQQPQQGSAKATHMLRCKLTSRYLYMQWSKWYATHTTVVPGYNHTAYNHNRDRNHTFSSNQVICTANSLGISTATLHTTTAQTPNFVIMSRETSENPRP